MFGWAHQQYFNFFPLWVAIGAGIIVFLAAKRLFRPAYARDSKQKLIGPDVIWLLSFVLAGLMIVALAGPKTDKFKMVSSRDNLDIIVALDTSASMAVKDIAPSRHDVMMREVKAFVTSSAVRGGDRLTIFTFSEKSNWRMPLSQDKDEFLDKLLEIEQPKDRVYYDRSQLSTYFSGLLDHIPKALDIWDNFSESSYPRVVFMFSDGDTIDSSLNTSLAVLARKEIKIYVIGVGTSRGGSLTIMTPAENNPKNLEPALIRSQLNMKALNLIKDKTGGKSFVLSNSSDQVQGFMAAALEENRKPTLTLARTGEAENFWREFLAIPALITVFLMTVKFVRY